MPRFDGTGPRGEGSRTGWGRGTCGPSELRGVGRAGRPAGGGRGRCWGGGRRAGFGRAGAVEAAVPEIDLQGLKARAEALEAELEELREQLGMMEAARPKKTD
ncbi:MAG: DUF5320 domain-containing protein [Myxococcales bacterium]|jgi:hypothetical protein